MATTPYFRWRTQSSAAAAADSDAVAGFGLGVQEMTTTAADTVPVAPDRCAVAGRPLTRRNSSGSGKQQQQQQKGGGGAKKPPQRGLGVAELERLRCGGDPLRELGAAAAQFRRLMHCNRHHHLVPAHAFDARYCSPPLPASPRPVAPGCCVHHPVVPACRAWLPDGPSVGAGAAVLLDGPVGPYGAGGDHQASHPLPSLAPEHPSNQSTVSWRPATSSSSCFQSGYRCDLCARRMTRAAPFAEKGAPPPPTQPSPSPTATGTMPDYPIYDLAAAMATSRPQGEAAVFAVRDTKRGPLPGEAEAPDDVLKNNDVVGEIEFFPAATTRDACTGTGTGTDLDGWSEFAACASSSYGAASDDSRAAAPLDLSLRL